MNVRQVVRLELERLERREVLSGNVTASVVGGELVIVGDNEANKIVVFQDGTKICVQGAPDSTTKVNNSDQPFCVDIGTGGGPNIRIDLRSGDDFVAIDVQTAGDVTIDTGNGSDQVRLAGRITGDVAITTGNGVDRVDMDSGLVIEGNADIDTGNGDDTIRTSTAGDRVKIMGDLNVEMGNGDDVLELDNLELTGIGNLDGGRGKDRLSGGVGSNFNPISFELP